MLSGFRPLGLRKRPLPTPMLRALDRPTDDTLERPSLSEGDGYSCDRTASPHKAKVPLMLPKSAVGGRTVQRRADDAEASCHKDGVKEPFLQKRKLSAIPEAPSWCQAPQKEGSKADVLKAATVSQLLAALRDDATDADQQLRALTQLRQVLATHSNPPIQQVIQAGGLELLVEKLQSPSRVMQLEAAWALTNAAIGTAEQTEALVKAGATEAILRLLSSAEIGQSHELCNQCLWTLANIAGDANVAMRDHLLASGVVNVLGGLFSQMPDFCWNLAARHQILRTFTWLMSALCRGQPAPRLEEVDCMFDYFAQVILGTDDTQMLSQAIWGVCYLLDGSKEDPETAARGARLLSAGYADGKVPTEHPLLQKVIRCMRQPGLQRSPLAFPSLRVVGALASTSAPGLTDAVLSAGVLKALRENLQDSRTPMQVQRDSAWILSNIAAGTMEQAVKVAQEPNLWEALCDSLERGTAHQVRRECAWALTNLIKRGASVLSQLECRKVTKVIVQRLINETDTSLQQALLDATEVILRYGDELVASQGLSRNAMAAAAQEAGLLEELEELQRAPLDAIYRKAVHVLEKWFGADSARVPREKLMDDASPVKSPTRTPSAIVGGSPKRPMAYRFGA